LQETTIILSLTSGCRFQLVVFYNKQNTVICLQVLFSVTTINLFSLYFLRKVEILFIMTGIINDKHFSAVKNVRRSSMSQSACPGARQCADHIQRIYAAGNAPSAPRLTTCQRKVSRQIQKMLIQKMNFLI